MNPRERHSEALNTIFHFLWNDPKKSQLMDPSNTTIYESLSHSNADWAEVYQDVVE